MVNEIITPDQEVKVVEGTVASEIAKVEPEVAPKEPSKPETVPLPVYLELKDDVKALKQELKEAKNSSAKAQVEIQGVGELSSKYPDVNEEFIKDMLSSATKEATRTIEAKYTPILEKQELEKKQVAFDKAFDTLFDKTLLDNPDLPKTIDKDLVKELALTPKYRNTPLTEILVKMYGGTVQGKPSSENEMRSGADRVEDIVSFDNITASQRATVMDDPKARAKFFDYLDTHAGR